MYDQVSEFVIERSRKQKIKALFKSAIVGVCMSQVIYRNKTCPTKNLPSKC